MITRLSAQISGYIAANVGQPENEDAVAYGSEIVIRSLIKIFIISIVSNIFGIFYETWTIVAFSALLRIFSGGVHCHTYTNCLFTSTLAFSLLGLLVRFVTPQLNFTMLAAFLVVSALLLFFICMLWIPAGSENRPLDEVGQKNKFKLYSLFIIFIHFFASLTWLDSFHGPGPHAFLFASVTGLLWQGFTVTPWGYSLISRFDNLLNAIKGGVQSYVQENQ